jgi:hypothetical protein
MKKLLLVFLMCAPVWADGLSKAEEKVGLMCLKPAAERMKQCMRRDCTDGSDECQKICYAEGDIVFRGCMAQAKKRGLY